MTFLLFFTNQKKAAFQTIIVHFLVLFGFIQPLVFFIQKEAQYSHSFLGIKYFLIIFLVFVFVVFYEGFLVKISPFFGFIYLIFPIIYIILEKLNTQIMKNIYSVLGLHNEDDLFTFPDNALGVNEAEFEAYFFNYTNHPKIVGYSRYLREKFDTSGAQKKNKLIWRIMKSIIQLQKEEDFNFLKNERKQKVESHFRILMRNRILAIEPPKTVEKKQLNLKMYKTHDDENERVKLPSFSEKKLDPSRQLASVKTNSLDQMSFKNINELKQNEEHIDSSIEIKDNQDVGFFLNRLKRLQFPIRWYKRILFVVFFPWHLLFSLILPNIKMVIRLKDLFFGTISCVLLITGLVFGIYFCNTTMNTFSNLNSLTIASINSSMSLSFLFYCLKFENHKELLLGVSLEELVIFEVSFFMFIGSISHMVNGDLTVLSSVIDLSITLSFLGSFVVLYIVFSFLFRERIPFWILPLNVFIVAGYVPYYLFQSKI